MNTINKASLHKLLSVGLQQLGLAITIAQQEQLCTFLLLLEKWNKIHNLTAVHAIEDMVSKHILDSLVVAPFLVGKNIIDVGTGAGLPGIPLSIMRPELQFVLLDSSLKRISFLTAVMASLGLNNVKPVHSMVEQYKTAIGFDVVISRAFSELGNFISSSTHLCHQDGFFLAMKGKISQVKNEPLPDGYLLTKIETLAIPGINGERCLVFVSKKAN